MSDPLGQLISDFAEVTAAARVSRPDRRARRSYSLARAFMGALVVIVVASVALVVLATRVPQSPAASMAVSRSGDFQLTLTTDSTEYTQSQDINAVAELAYVGSSPSVEIGSLGPRPIGFGVRQIGGSIDYEPEWEAMCIPVDLTRDDPLRQPFTKSGGWSNSDPNRDFYAWFVGDPQLHLPSGNWEIYAKVDAGPDGNDCQGQIELQASVTITVLPGSPLPIPSLPTPFPPGVPTPPPVPMSTPTPTTSPAPSPAATPAISVAADGTNWSVVDAQALPATSISSIAASDGRFIAWAESCPDPGTCLLTSDDGVSWTVVGSIAAPPAEITTVIHAGNIWLAGGRVGDAETGGGFWTSADGVSWQWRGGEPAFQHSGCPADQAASDEVYELYATDSVLVAEGEDDCGAQRADLATWHSTDGITWQRVDAPQMFGVAKSNGIYGGSGRNSSFRWSTDGLEWSDAVSLKGWFQFAPVASGFVGLTPSTPGLNSHQIVTSSDGSSWTRQPDVFGSAWTESDLISDGSRAVVVGGDYPQIPHEVWVSSANGAEWTRFELPSDQDLNGAYAAILGHRVVVVGTDSSKLWTTDVP